MPEQYETPKFIQKIRSKQTTRHVTAKKGVFTKAAEKFDGWSFTRFLKSIEPYLLIITIAGFIITLYGIKEEREARAEERKEWERGRKVDAWQLLTTKAPGNSGKKEALETLNRMGEPLPGVDLSVKESEGAYLVGVDLSHANLEHANLYKANLRGANLEHASLQEAYLHKADLRDANLLSVDLERAELQDADLQEANLQEAKLEGANLQNANLQGAKLMVTDLRGANLQNANLQGAKLGLAKLQGADLDLADLRDARLMLANLKAADLQQADLSNAILWEADLRNVENITCTQLKQAKNWRSAYRNEELACGAEIPELPEDD